MPEPVVVVGGALLLLAMLGGKKKKGGGPGSLLDPKKSDPLPQGSKGGFLPKGKGYGSQIPQDMTSEDLWISDDCQAFVMGQNWLPMVDGMSAYQWMLQEPQLEEFKQIDKAISARGASSYISGDQQGADIPLIQLPDVVVMDFAKQLQGALRFNPLGSLGQTKVFWGDYWSVAYVGIYPQEIPLSARFAIKALGQSSMAAGTCAETLPSAAGQGLAQWNTAFKDWQEDYPVISYILGIIQLGAAPDITLAIDEALPSLGFGEA